MNRLTHNSRTWKRAAGFLGALIIFLLATVTGTRAAQNVTLAWQPGTNSAATGFKIYYGPSTRVYTNSLAVGNVTNATITGLVEGATYYFAATTSGTGNRESAFSPEVIHLIPAPPTPPANTNTLPTNTVPVITNTVPVVTNTVPVVTNTPPVITNTIPGLTNTVPVITNSTPVLTNTPPVLTNPVPVINPAALPKLDPIADQFISPGSVLRSVVLTGFSPGLEGSRIINVSASSSDSNLVSGLAFQMGSSGTAGTLIFRTAANALGKATVTVTVRNNRTVDNSFSRSFNVALVAANPVSNLRPPTFFRKPDNIVTVAGRNVSLSTAATGLGRLNYAWKFNGKAIPGATGATLTLKKVSAAQSGLYSVTVTSAFGSTNSLAAVTVLPSPAATLGAMTRAANGNFTFPVTGVPGYKYVVQATTDLTHWIPVQTNAAPFVFEDRQTADNEKRFFRVYYDPAL
jgi:hypothetical protein